ncbi:hypothetical protein BDY19DRAFT_990897 [Irpex rosettiformis]|uniref:Uncharacterized protein n=1 Tax=Irpex rosettiformis TaxID=378272 RepID=A0ACB8UD32_9APHY|nr:hypothetical protein BDY19DRAFT_990897 [Irpex rosettiformis]
MPTAIIDDEGTAIYYEDSGIPPESTDYTTLILIHGYVVHARKYISYNIPSDASEKLKRNQAIFRVLFPYAAAHNLRLIAINQREYPGSSPLSEAQLALFHSTDEEDQESVVVDCSRDLAHFVAWVVKHEHTPAPGKTASGKKTGGIGMWGWSAGCATLFGMLANLHSFDEALRNTLEENVTTLVIYDPPSVVIGVADPPGTYSPATDLKTPPDQLTEAFIIWASTWFEPFSSLDAVNSTSIVTQKKLTDPSDPRHLSSFERMSQEEKDATLFPDIAIRLGPGLVSWEICDKNVRGTVLDTKGVLKNVRLNYFWGANSPWNCAWAAKVVEGLMQEPPVEGQQRREVVIEMLEDMHHFGHHDHPERMMRVIADHIS